jgi:hypothetical protein
VKGFHVGIEARGDSANVTLNSGIMADKNDDGLRIDRGSQAKISIADGFASYFNQNNFHGIDSYGKLTIENSTPNGTHQVVGANSNTQTGVVIQPNAAPTQLSALSASRNQTNGLWIYAGNTVNLYRSSIQANTTNGVVVHYWGDYNTQVSPSPSPYNDISNINLGTIGSTTAGQNTLQTVTNANGYTGICLDVYHIASVGPLKAEGNVFPSPAPSNMNIDCNMRSGPVKEAISSKSDLAHMVCAGQTAVGVAHPNSQCTTDCGNAFDLNMCTNPF